MLTEMNKVVGKERLQFETPLEKIYREGKENPQPLFGEEKQEVRKEEAVESPKPQEPIAETEPEK